MSDEKAAARATPPTDEAPRPPSPARAPALRAAALVLALGALCLGAGVWSSRAHLGADAPALSDADRKAAADTVHLYLMLSAHLRGTGGDERFAERLPASAEVVDELMREAAFLKERGRSEEARLVRLEVVEVSAAGPEAAAIRTREFWITRVAGSAAPAKSDVVGATYELRREAAGWRVASWDVDFGATARSAAER